MTSPVVDASVPDPQPAHVECPHCGDRGEKALKGSRISLAVLSVAFAIILAVPGPSAAGDAADAARAYRNDHEQEIIGEFREFLALPNVASDLADMDRNAAWITRKLGEYGFETSVWRAGGAPYVFAEKRVDGAGSTLLIYAHFDGQPVAPEEWASPPWEPTLRDGMVETGGQVIRWDSVDGNYDPEWRIFARSAGDDKAPVIALMAALDGLEAAGIEPSVNIKLLLDGEEEAGSPTLAAVLQAHGQKLDTDLMLFCDGPMHQSRRRQLVFGVRGSMTVDLTTYGAIRPLHSGHYGNWAPNPTDALVRLLAAMKGPDGEVIVPGFADAARPITAAERAAIDGMPDIDAELKAELALGRTEGGGERIESLMLRPAIIVKGLQAGAVGSQSSNVIRPTATASLNVRLVPDQKPAAVMESLERFFENQGFHIVHSEPSPDLLQRHDRVLRVDGRPGAYPGFRSRLDGPEAQRLVRILDDIDGQATLLTPTMGGSLPVYLFERALDAPIILLPVANHDNNQHGRDENLRLQNLWDAIEVYASVLAEFGNDE